MDFKKLVPGRIIAFIILLVCLIFILSDSEWLLWRVSFLFGFHIGTIVAWIGLVASSFISTRFNKKIQLMRILSSISFYISIFWLLLSFVLAGNNNLIFTDENRAEFICWLGLTSFPPLVFAISIIYSIIAKIIKPKKVKAK